MEFNDRLRNIRIERGLSQDEVAKRAGTTKQSISRYENSVKNRQLQLLKILRMPSAYHLNIFIMGKKKPPPFLTGGGRKSSRNSFRS